MAASILLRYPKFFVRDSLTKFRPLPLAHLASSATGSARIAPHRTSAFKWVRVRNRCQKKRPSVRTTSFLVPVTGLEPVRHRWRWILSPLRLPFHHTGMVCILFGYLHIRRIRFASAGVRLRCPKFSVRCSLTKFRPLPIAQVASSATGGAPIAPQTLTAAPSLAVDFESTTSTISSHRHGACIV